MSFNIKEFFAIGLKYHGGYQDGYVLSESRSSGTLLAKSGRSCVLQSVLHLRNIHNQELSKLKCQDTCKVFHFKQHKNYFNFTEIQTSFSIKRESHIWAMVIKNSIDCFILNGDFAHKRVSSVWNHAGGFYASQALFVKWL